MPGAGAAEAVDIAGRPEGILRQAGHERFRIHPANLMDELRIATQFGGNQPGNARYFTKNLLGLLEAAGAVGVRIAPQAFLKFGQKPFRRFAASQPAVASCLGKPEIGPGPRHWSWLLAAVVAYVNVAVADAIFDRI